MSAPNAQLQAALRHFANEPGVTTQQVRQLQSAIVATPNLLRAFNEDAAAGQLQGFTLMPQGQESIGRYDIATKRIAIPPEVLTGTEPVDPDLRSVLKLQDMSLRFAHTADVTADMHANLERSINESPFLVDQFKDAVRNESQRHLRSFDLETSDGPGGSYDPDRRSINLTATLLTPGTFDQHSLTFVLGHELGHGFNRIQLSNSHDAYISQLRSIAGDNDPINVYTPAMQARLQAHRVDEGESQIVGWNAMLSYELQRSGNPNVTLQDMWDSANRGHVEDFLMLDPSGNAVARPGLTFNADNSLTATPGANGNVEATGRYYFDQAPVGTPRVALADTVNLGPYKYSDYNNYYGTAAISLAIWAEQAIAIPKHGNASQMHVNMQSLNLSEPLLEENGIFIARRSTASQAYWDTSTTPPVVGRFDHTSDGRNANQYMPLDASVPAAGTRTSGASRAGPGEVVPETAADAPKPPEALLLSDPTHLGHGMYLQTLKAFDDSPNIRPGTFTQQEKEILAAGLVAQALTQEGAFPKAQVDHVVFNRDRTMIIGVQGPLESPTNFLAGVNVQQTLATSFEQSSEVSQVALQAMQQRHEQARIQTETQAVDALTATGPVMRMGGRTSSASGEGGAQGGGGDGS